MSSTGDDVSPINEGPVGGTQPFVNDLDTIFARLRDAQCRTTIWPPTNACFNPFWRERHYLDLQRTHARSIIVYHIIATFCSLARWGHPFMIEVGRQPIGQGHRDSIWLVHFVQQNRWDWFETWYHYFKSLFSMKSRRPYEMPSCEGSSSSLCRQAGRAK
jgi:hypothetical protein